MCPGHPHLNTRERMGEGRQTGKKVGARGEGEGEEREDGEREDRQGRKWERGEGERMRRERIGERR